MEIGYQRVGNQRRSIESFLLPFYINKPFAKYFLLFFIFLLLIGSYLWTTLLDTNSNELQSRRGKFSLNCSFGNNTRTCPVNYYPADYKFVNDNPSSSSPHCPHYFHWIHEDLKPWRKTGITEEMVERANRTANFRLVILNGRAYVETYEKGFQTRDVFTLWGILQLLRRYPEKIPDLDMMFDCVDWPVVRSSDFAGENAVAPPPLFRYCGDNETLDIVFPDWSFWGWAEINIKPWQDLLKDLDKGNRMQRWQNRAPYAYWKGNPEVAEKRMELVKCNVTENQEWNARIYVQDWKEEIKQGFKHSDLGNQCHHRYKIYIEGSAWSVSEKYILACDSVSLLVTPHYYDFFSRSLLPLVHYWPINEDDKCASIKFAVDWGNKYKKKSILTDTTPTVSLQPQKKLQIQLNCTNGNLTNTCPASYYPLKFTNQNQSNSSSPTCPDYFRWIYDDLWPWRETGVTKAMVMSGKNNADFRLVIVDGRAYVETYRESFQSRDTFTLWGILQMLRRYPGKIPDLDLMFDCGDSTVTNTKFYRLPNAPAPPPLFRYCGNNASLDIVFPDWSFWGWVEINIKPWETLSKELKKANEKLKWSKREPYAYWKGNPYVGRTRMDMLKCNVSEKQDWNARIYKQDWIKEQKQGFKQSNLASQCKHRYKIYVEGNTWSVSEKYILACDSVTLLVKPDYYDFYSRGLMPLKHYWPVNNNDKCRSIKHAVHWGNTHQKEAQEIGKAANDFLQEQLKMDYVYDYMFHLLSEYAKLLKYKPAIPKKAIELCSEVMACPAEGVIKKFMEESMVQGPSDAIPCNIPPPFSPADVHSLLVTKEKLIKQVESWEQQYWNKNKTKQH